VFATSQAAESARDVVEGEDLDRRNWLQMSLLDEAEQLRQDSWEFISNCAS
jgi:hypothetical protein